MYVSINYGIIGLYNSLSHVQCQALIWTNDGHVKWSFRIKFPLKWNENTIIFMQENEFENVVSDMEVVLTRSQYDNSIVTMGQFVQFHHGMDLKI